MCDGSVPSPQLTGSDRLKARVFRSQSGTINVGLDDRSAPPKKTYRVQTLADDDRVLGQLDAATLNLLKAQLEQWFTKGG